MHELNALKEIAELYLISAGFSLEEEASHPDAFGSYYAIYARAWQAIRFVWDGKEGCGLLEYRFPGEDAWQPLGPSIPEASSDEMRDFARSAWGAALERIL